MRKAYPTQLRFDTVSIENVALNLECRDSIVPVLRALRHVYADRQLTRFILGLIAEDINDGTRSDTGRKGIAASSPRFPEWCPCSSGTDFPQKELFLRERNPAFVDDISRKARMHELPDTNESLIARVKDPRDAAAWSEFLAIYRPVVYRLARSRGLQHADAEDLVQQVFMSIARAIERWEPGADMPPFRAWLYRVARNAVVKAVTRKKPDRGAGSTSVRELLDETPEARGSHGVIFAREPSGIFSLGSAGDPW